ncbi:DNA alkylation repair protein [Allobranchiibius sp. GilTou73]|uniref:DNA alkylation repair protein n=1 Tax=Allobranchiibius sp. GilTou73 TaxID=2904523 RepID=UPI001F205A19|nr:DNA alkylation repair protein [Allobranchiibius sp. GilTou73]UIJ33988.1 DNA alkylation repair protein [Allobranchiibius sp. GilTou73]
MPNGHALTDARSAMRALGEVADPGDVPALQRYFKTGPGEYGEGDVFIGVRMPAVREVARQASGMGLVQLDVLLDSPVHEHRQLAVIVLGRAFATASTARGYDERARAAYVAFYLAAVRRGRIDNWDLVDASAEFILGEYLVDRDRRLLLDLAGSPVLWERRVAVLASFAFIKHGDASTTLQLAEQLLGDPEPLLQKAVGWMLREVGKRVDVELLRTFLDGNAARMPRTMLTYAVEHLEPSERTHYRSLRSTSALAGQRLV